MDVFSIITLLGGLAFFLYGMKVMSDGLEKSARGNFNKNLKKVADNRFFAMLFGAGITIAVQSSSAVTVMMVGLVSSGILEFSQTVGMLMGANIGSTFTSWISSLAGIGENGGFFLQLLKPANLGLIFAVAGVVIVMMKKKRRLQSLGNAFIGFSILMFGMNLMSGAMEPLSDMPEFTKLLTAFENPLIAVAVGAVFTGIIQSSAASVGILQAMSLTGGITYSIAIPIIMGQNIGTCVTALISSIGVNRKAKKVAVMHLSINIIGTLICMIPFYIATAIVDLPFVHQGITPFMIAVGHSIFNIVTVLILLPFSKQLVRLANLIIPDREKGEQSQIILDDRLLAVPSMAAKKSLDAVYDMCAVARKAFLSAITLMERFDEKKVDEINEMEQALDRYEDQLSTYMMKLTKLNIAEEDLKSVARILHTIDDFERIGDHSVNMIQAAQELHDKGMNFSEDANRDLEMLHRATCELLNLTAEAFQNNNPVQAASVEPLRQVISNLILAVKRNHVFRLQSGDCTTELGFVLSEILTCYERVAGHCSNIAVAVIETRHGTFDTHEYLHGVRGQDEEYNQKFQEYSKQFSMEV